MVALDPVVIGYDISGASSSVSGSGSTVWWSCSGCSGGMSQGRPLYAVTCEVVLLLGRPSDWPDCAASANPFLSLLSPGEFLESN